MSNASFSGSVVLAIGLFAGVGLAGYFANAAVIKAKEDDRYITVKGIAEEQVKANLGVFEIDYREVGGNLLSLNASVIDDQRKVINYFHQKGFSDSEIEVRPTKVNDAMANPYNNNSAITPEAKMNRYIVFGGVRVRSSNVDQIQKATQDTSALINQDVPLSFNTADYSSDLSPNPSYFYTNLDQIRPSMLSTATQSAYLVATQFVKETHSQLGGILHANQGVFQLFSRDANAATGGSINEAGSIYKKVRLVTTIQFFLKDAQQS